MKKYSNFVKYLQVLEKAEYEDLDNEFIISGIIDKFYIQFELGWKTLKELLKYEGAAVGQTGSPREIIKAAYACLDFVDEELWLSMLKQRNDHTHIYDGQSAKKLVQTIIEKYIPVFVQVKDAIEKEYGDVLDQI